MSYNSKYIFIIPLSIFFTISLVYLFTMKNKHNSTPHSTSESTHRSTSESTQQNNPVSKDHYSIKPSQFDTGIIKQDTYKSSNLCNNTVLKPIIPVNVDYGWEMPENCPCCKYIEPP